MDDFDLEDLGSATGGELRKRLEEALKANRDMASKLALSEAERFIAGKGLKLVKPEDLVGVPLDQIETRAAEVEKAKQGERDVLLRSVLAEKGVPEDGLDAALQALIGDNRSQQAATLSQIRDIGRTTGSVPSLMDPNQMTPEQMIRAGVSR